MKARSILTLSCSVLFFLSDNANGMIPQNSGSYESNKYSPRVYKITNQNYKNEIATMDLPVVKDFLNLVKLGIDDNIHDLEDILTISCSVTVDDNTEKHIVTLKDTLIILQNTDNDNYAKRKHIIALKNMLKESQNASENNNTQFGQFIPKIIDHLDSIFCSGEIMLLLQQRNEELEILTHLTSDYIAKMDLNTTVGYLHEIRYIITRCELRLDDMLKRLESIENDDTEEVEKLKSLIKNLVNKVNDSRKIRLLLQQRIDQLTCLKDKMIILTEGDRNNIVNREKDLEMDNAICDILMKIEQEAERITGYGMFLWDEAEQRFTVSE